MTSRSQALTTLLSLLILLTIALAACQTETIEVTRIKIMERRVIERVIVTVEVTRIQRVAETPKPTPEDLIPRDTPTATQSTPTQPPATATPTAPRPTSATAATRVPSTGRVGESLLAALKDAEQIFLSLVQALNSDPLPMDHIIQLYDTLRGASTFAIPENEAVLQSIHLRYREQIENAIGQATDLYTHLVAIQAGEAAQTEVSPTHLGLARDAASTGTSTLQALIRELETYLNSQP